MPRRSCRRGASIQKDYGVTSTPTHYLLDASGKVLSRHGGCQKGDEVQLEQEIKRALGGAAISGKPHPFHAVL